MTTIAFTGDVAFSEYFKDAWQGPVTDETIDAFLHSAQYVAANIEGAVTGRAFDRSGLLRHTNPPEAAPRLAQMHMNVWTLSNNHVSDCGFGGVLDTLQAARACRCIPVGVGESEESIPEPIILDGGDCRVGVLSVIDARKFYEDKIWRLSLDREQVVRGQIQALKEKTDHVVAIVHAGREYMSIPLPEERKWFHKLLDWGVDVVVGHHPHVVRNYERVGRKLIFYSLGNFIFDTPTQRLIPHTDEGILLRLSFSPKGVDWTYLTTRIDRAAQRVCAAGKPGTGAPAVFQHLSGWEYRLLWPLAVVDYRQNTRVKMASLQAKKSGTPKSKRQQLARRIKHMKDRAERQQLYGCIMAALGTYRLSRRQDVVRYLMQGRPEQA